MKEPLALLLAAACFTPLALQAQNDVTIGVSLDSPLDGNYELTGQSAFMQFYAGGMSTGGQLDGIMSGSTGLGFTEVFSPPPLEDYVAWSYFGRINTYDSGNALVDRSFVIALQGGTGVGLKVEDLFAYTESELVTAFDTYDSPEFLDILVGGNGIDSVVISKGAFTIAPLGAAGSKLDLIAFIGGPGGDVGVKVGEMSVAVVPEPGPAGLLGILGAILLLRRRA